MCVIELFCWTIDHSKQKNKLVSSPFKLSVALDTSIKEVSQNTGEIKLWALVTPNTRPCMILSVSSLLVIGVFRLGALARASAKMNPCGLDSVSTAPSRVVIGDQPYHTTLLELFFHSHAACSIVLSHLAWASVSILTDYSPSCNYSAVISCDMFAILFLCCTVAVEQFECV